MSKTSVTSHVQFDKSLVHVLDLQFSFWKLKFGIDPLLDIIPGFGNILSTVVSCYLFYIAYRVRVPTKIYFHMFWNLGVDYVVGVIPFIGIFFDLLYRANVRNFSLIEKFVDPEVLEGELVTS